MHTQPNSIGRYPYRTIFVPFPLVAFTFALVTDILYWQTSVLMWQNFSAWLLLGGLVFGALAILAGLGDVLRANARHYRPGWAETIGFAVILILGLVNSFVHAGDGWTAVVPGGLILSALTFIAIIATLWLAAVSPLSQEWRILHD
ncbi:DUF2231 domain-containing protein [Martelella endophytica]|uniref:DUF2231 domain-containing protein n=1 Tax=Martelella endophytica TaxID=1486262 RepID=UPI0005F1FDA2|nr:DUF2231 domain-containing protein [Martelella endophytica]